MPTAGHDTVPSATPDDRSAVWLALLQRLTVEAAGWLLWKNAESAFHGVGDVDIAAAPAEWPTIEAVFVEWADANGLGPTIVCRHSPGGLKLIAVPEGEATFFELDAKAQRRWRGSRLFGLEDLTTMAVMDPRGFRRLRPGAEGFYKLLLNGTRWSGLADEAAMSSKDVREQLRSDPVGVRAAAALLGPARQAAEVGARRAAAGGWSWPAMMVVQGWAILRGVATPRATATRLRFRLRGRSICPVIDAVLGHGRRIPARREAWIARLAEDHVVHR